MVKSFFRSTEQSTMVAGRPTFDVKGFFNPEQGDTTNSYDAFRPTTWDTYIGQKPLKTELRIATHAARTENRPVRPILLIGPPGYGKTSLAAIVASDMGVPLVTFTCPFEAQQLIRALRKPAVVFFDEIHRSLRKEQETLLNLIEDGYMLLGHRKLMPNNVSFMAATTEPQKLVGPLVDRFEIRPTFDPYTEEEMGEIVAGMVARTKLQWTPEDCVALGHAAAGTPRNAKSLVKAGADLLTVNQTQPTIQDVFQLKRVRPDGLSVEHCRYLILLGNQEGRASQQLLATALHLPPAALIQLEQLLITKNLILVTPRGRALSEDGWAWVEDNNAS